MNEQRTDFELLRDFTRQGDQAAFAEVARRHVDLVYATALRKVEDTGAAEEVAQNVFLALARKAWQFAPDDSLPAWLYRTTLLQSKQWLRGELRRRRREQTAAELGTTMKTPDEQAALRALTPLLDEAMLSLHEADRTALLLRFYESQSMRDIGASLGVGEDAAQKRVARALQKLTGFFQRRGFKSATVAVTATALEHTTFSAPALVAASVSQAAAGMAPPLLGGLLALASRLTSLTKLQTAAACLVVAAVPVTWQWNQQRQGGREVQQARAARLAAEQEYAVLQTEIEKLRQSSAQLDAALAGGGTPALPGAEAAQNFEEWKKRLRGLLTASDYRWPEDSPFVRIPKSALRSLNVPRPVSPPGILKREARELLGLSPEERERMEGALQKHIAALDGLIEADMASTNTPRRVRVPKSALASQAWSVPPLGPEANASSEELKAALHETAGDERWPLLESQLGIGGTHSLQRVLNLDAAGRGQEVAVWLTEGGNGKILVSYGWSGDSASFSTTGIGLEMFLPNPPAMSSDSPYKDPSAFLDGNDLPVPVTRRLLDWLQNEALRRCGKETNR